MESIRLFNAVQVAPDCGTEVREDDFRRCLALTAPHGFVLSPRLLNHLDWSPAAVRLVMREVKESVGITGSEANSSLHKSWAIIRDAFMENLVLDQMLHYLTTYGFQRAGVYDAETVYFPPEKLEIPGLVIQNLKLTVIHGLDREELKERLVRFLSSGVALKERVATDAAALAVQLGGQTTFIKDVKNREVRCQLYDAFGVVPSDPIEMLRLLVYVMTGSALIIKSKESIEAIKVANKTRATVLLNNHVQAVGYEPLASVFLRHKPLFLAMRTTTSMRQATNRLRRLATTCHEPSPRDLLGQLVPMLTAGAEVRGSDLAVALSQANTYRKVRLAQAINYHFPSDMPTGPRPLVYKVRNGKSYTGTTKGFAGRGLQEFDCLRHVLGSVASDVFERLSGRTVYLPEEVEYGLPSSQKQFTGNVPSGTRVRLGDEMVFGVWWRDLDRNRPIDLDLALILPDGTKVGWDGTWRTDNNDLLFSGDVTSAPQGASELFYVSSKPTHTTHTSKNTYEVRPKDQNLLVTLNWYNMQEYDESCPFKIVVGRRGDWSKLKDNHMLDPNDLVASVPCEMTRKQKVVGMVKTSEEGCDFYFCESDNGRAASSRSDDVTQTVRRYLQEYHQGQVTLKQVLDLAGARYVDSPEDADVDLSIENLTQDSFTELLG